MIYSSSPSLSKMKGKIICNKYTRNGMTTSATDILNMVYPKSDSLFNKYPYYSHK